MTFHVLNETKLQEQRKTANINFGSTATDVIVEDAWSETERIALQQRPVNQIC